jgi:hypothetical protein
MILNNHNLTDFPEKNSIFVLVALSLNSGPHTCYTGTLPL